MYYYNFRINIMMNVRLDAIFVVHLGTDSCTKRASTMISTTPLSLQNGCLSVVKSKMAVIKTNIRSMGTTG